MIPGSTRQGAGTLCCEAEIWIRNIVVPHYDSGTPIS